MHAVTADVACRVMRTDRVTAGEPLPAQQAEAKRGTTVVSQRRLNGASKIEQGFSLPGDHFWLVALLDDPGSGSRSIRLSEILLASEHTSHTLLMSAINRSSTLPTSVTPSATHCPRLLQH
ncbi:uncharacterized protein SEPMUDRAFT_113918 [Sphaerulina musiva SO2202]|uniref:Uncharacterized protein n=1 Tax=Sphaerulina musiva (strain SO2202) TaxID=692275 RepID=N1QL03_SPHMS|nr:uncharacterized protein SEPMUDRAFT_113918 [Sphaerulina musiva SO2202]EMF17946.1 hypothetical protein SEPMUDRAFT_113918 [Sphaerulina musiva SO2202]